VEDAVAEYCSAPLSRIISWLASERFFTAREAKSEGLVDSIDAGGLPLFLREPVKRAPRQWLRSWRDFYERCGLREHVTADLAHEILTTRRTADEPGADSERRARHVPLAYSSPAGGAHG